MNVSRHLRAAAIAIIALFWLTPAVAQVKVCPLTEALKRLEDYNVYARADAAQKQIPFLNELEVINRKAKNPSLPVGAQLAKADLDRFQKLREEMLAIQAHELISSGYLRDSRVIARTAKVAQDLSLGRTYEENDPDFFYYSTLMLLAVANPQDALQLTTPQEGECSVEAGLHFDEQIIAAELSKGADAFQAAIAKLTAIGAKYHFDTKNEGWVEKIPNLAEKQSARGDLAIVKETGRKLDYVKNIENLKLLARVSVLGYQSDLEDIKFAHTEAELSKIGTGWVERSKRYDERIQVIGGLLNMIAQKIPSDFFVEAQGRNKMLKEQGIIR